jgi:PKD repeat protein
MRKSILTILTVLLMLGAVLVFTSNVSACHNMAATCSPTEKDITDINTWSVTYEIDVKLTPGCGNQYWVGFTVSSAPPKFHRKLYEKDDATETNIMGSGQPPDADHNNWAGWISVGSGSEVHFYAILEVWSDAYTPNGQQATITVDVWSCDVVPNDLEHRVITTITTVNIPNGIVMSHSIPFMATQWVKPGEWAEFDIKIKDIGDAYGLIDLTKDPMSSDCLEDDWNYELPASANLPEDGTVVFKLRVQPPSDAEDDDYAIFIVQGVNNANSNYRHTVTAKTIVAKPKPDLSVRDDTGEDNIKLITDDGEYSAGQTYIISLNVYNLGDLPVSNFDVTCKLSTIGEEELIGSQTITTTLNKEEFVNVQQAWVATEHELHSIMVVLDENNLIREKDEETNNEAGLVVTVEPAKPKSIILSMNIDPTSCMPETEFTVSGTAKYNPEYGSVPVKDASVQIKIKETDTIFNTKTNSKGEYTKACTAPTEPDTYTLEVSITDGTISASKNNYISVSLFQVTVLVNPLTVITGDTTMISGKVTDASVDVPDADITLKLTDSDGKVAVEETAKTDIYGFYNKEVTAPSVTEYAEYEVEVTATKDEISGSQKSKLFVDIDTDSDGIGNLVDSDDDGDIYPDDLENTYGFDSLDINDAPFPVAKAGSDQTINEGSSLSFDAGNSFSPAGLTLTYKWDFGDESEVSTSKTPNKKFNSDGTYTVQLTVEDEYKYTDTESVTITVNDLDPVAEITGSSNAKAGISLEYSAELSTSPADKIVKYEWDWTGDGVYETTTTPKASHIWTKSATYTVTLRITDEDGDSSTDSIDVIITGSIKGKDGGSGSSKSDTADYTWLYATLAIIIVVVLLLSLFMVMRKKKAAEEAPADQRIASNLAAQSSRRPTTAFAEADVKPSLSAPGSVPTQQITAPVQQRSALPPTTLQPHPEHQQPSTTPTPEKEQRDWSWNFNE